VISYSTEEREGGREREREGGREGGREKAAVWGFEVSVSNETY